MSNDRSRRSAVHVLHLVDRTTGQPLRLNGRRLTVFARNPVIAARELMHGRDPGRWAVHMAPADQPPA
ncbi:hypothetical protein [Pseudooceanicola sp. LIPI14-2-Ac024]|uniref:hypothetical protein n=1 Tax=Pseudooceanicola sp. LIPI14-2-Ac024 TaxID=3344875 RepID=UPI0035D09394